VVQFPGAIIEWPYNYLPDPQEIHLEEEGIHATIYPQPVLRAVVIRSDNTQTALSNVERIKVPRFMMYDAVEYADNAASIIGSIMGTSFIINSMKASFNIWPIDFLLSNNILLMTGGENGFRNILHAPPVNEEAGHLLNQHCTTGFGNALNNSWDGQGTDVLFVETFPYSTFLNMGSFPWINELIDKAENVARNGGIVYIAGESWPFAWTLAIRAGMSLNFYAENAIQPYHSGLTTLRLHPDLAKETGVDSAVAVFFPDVHGPVINPANTGGAGMKFLAQGDIVAGAGGVVIDPGDVNLRRYPMAVEFPLGKGKVIYTSFSLEPNIHSSSSQEIKTVMREFMARPLRYAQERRTLRNLLAG
jgi:hypothetical protein